MELTLEQKDLAQATLIVAALLKRSANTMPVLSNLLIEAEDDHASFIGTDMESHARVRVPAQVKGGPGKVTLPADKLSELVGLLPAGAAVTLKDEGGQVVLTTEATQYRLVTLPADDYPQWHPDTASARFHVPHQQMRKMLDAVLYAIPQRDHRRVLNGALMEIRNGEALRLTATDGKKLSRISEPIGEIEGDDQVRVVVPGKLLGELRRNLAEEGAVAVEVGSRQAAFHFDNVEYRTQLIEGKYPDCDAVIPKDFPFTVRINHDRFKLAARRAGITSDDKNKSIILKFADNSCDFSSMAADVGAFAGRTSVEYDGNPLEIAFNFQLLVETLDSFGHPDIEIRIKSEQAPCLFHCAAEPQRECVLMPIKLADVRRPPTDEE
ncbi:MAG: DNA polymerase III subunit beta [Candidatus Sumerlaeia bacterium]|nr:DNA polymerase III subunit beta [Candidatus Sumerlaeia bacterium]